MPHRNGFRHQNYESSCPEGSYELLRAEESPAVGSADWLERMQRVGESLRGAGVGRIYLVHGTFLGNDALGVLREFSRLLPLPARQLGQFHKLMVDRVTSDAGNYTLEYARRFEQAIRSPAGEGPSVELFHWSSENHHLGRATGAIQLLDHLLEHPVAAGQRILLWGHSHAGNLFALLSNLLGADVRARRKFLYAARPHYARRWGCSSDALCWQRVVQGLLERTSPLQGTPLDFVTFGTPVRYGWDCAGYEHLLHFVSHRPVPGRPEYAAPFPPSWSDFWRAEHGDCIQHLGIAGTDLAPNWFTWRLYRANRRLSRILEPGLGRRELMQAWQLGRRVHLDGRTLLVDYGPEQGSFAQHLAGHGVYTRLLWLLFHAEQVAERFYRATTVA